MLQILGQVLTFPISLNIYGYSVRVTLLLFPFYKWKTVTQQLSNLLEVTQLVNVLCHQAKVQRCAEKWHKWELGAAWAAELMGVSRAAGTTPLRPPMSHHPGSSAWSASFGAFTWASMSESLLLQPWGRAWKASLEQSLRTNPVTH